MRNYRRLAARAEGWAIIDMGLLGPLVGGSGLSLLSAVFWLMLLREWHWSPLLWAAYVAMLVPYREFQPLLVILLMAGVAWSYVTLQVVDVFLLAPPLVSWLAGLREQVEMPVRLFVLVGVTGAAMFLSRDLVGVIAVAGLFWSWFVVIRL